MPVEPSASARRVVAVLTCLAGGDGNESTLTEVAAATEMNKTTCQSILLALGDSGYVLRDDQRKTYRLGPAVLALATSTGIHQEALARARAAMDLLSSELDVETTATVATDRDIVKVAQVPRPRMRGVTLRPGHAVALAYPLGAAHVAWSPQPAIHEWIERGGIERGDALAEPVLAGLAVIRARGFSATVDHPRRLNLTTAVEHASKAKHREERDRIIEELRRNDFQVLDLASRSTRRIFQLAAPVFGPDARVLLVIGILEHAEADATTIELHIERLLEVTQAITFAIGGVTPATASQEALTTN
jgi:DNA-binding IclR family transcriptional regulator